MAPVRAALALAAVLLAPLLSHAQMVVGILGLPWDQCVSMLWVLRRRRRCDTDRGADMPWQAPWRERQRHELLHELLRQVRAEAAGPSSSLEPTARRWLEQAGLQVVPVHHNASLAEIQQ
jgi:hypothetical protein